MQSMPNSPKTPNTKRNRLSNKEKVDMIKFMEINNLTATQMCEKFSLAPSTLSGILKKKRELLNLAWGATETELANTKSNKGSSYPDIEEVIQFTYKITESE